MKNREEIMNNFLVEIFNEILKTEENAIAEGGFKNLSASELHVIEAVCQIEEKGEDNRSTKIAKKVQVTAGTLTTSVSILEKKGYLERKRDDKDKRIVRIYSTELGKSANSYHKAFHKEMVDDILNTLTEEETAIFVSSLSNVSAFFRAKHNKLRNGQV